MAGKIEINRITNANIYVNGNGAADTGRAVAGEQDRVNSRLARNLAGASS